MKQKLTEANHPKPAHEPLETAYNLHSNSKDSPINSIQRRDQNNQTCMHTEQLKRRDPVSAETPLHDFL